MGNAHAELKSWHDWTDPDFFSERRKGETRFLPLFLRQLLPTQILKTQLTLPGWFLIIVALAIGTAAYNTASNILFLTLSLLLSSLILSGILSHLNFRKLNWVLHAPAHLKAGEVGMAEVDIVNRKSVLPSMSLCFCAEAGADAGEKRLHLRQSLSAGESTKLEWTFVPHERGRFIVRLSSVESQYPFGFLCKSIGIGVEEEVLIWPAEIDYSFSATSSGQRFISGTSRRNVGTGSDLLSLRPYERGDPPRLVHWKATARTGKLMIRQLAQEGENGYHLYVDPDAGLWEVEQFERLCSVACSLANDLFHLGRLDSVEIAGEEPVLVRSIRDVHDFFDQLALLERRSGVQSTHHPTRSNRITFRPLAEHEIAIYVEESQTGQTNH